MFVTAGPGEEGWADLLALGAAAVLPKPLRLADVAAALAVAIG